MRRLFALVLVALSCDADTTTFVSDQNATTELTPDTSDGPSAAPEDPEPPAGGVVSDAGPAGSPVSPAGGGSGPAAVSVEIADAAPPDAGPARECARFQPIPLPAGFSDSTNSHLSGDGLLVVANGARNVAYAQRWRQGNSMIVLSPLDGDTVTSVTAVNRDGSVIVGRSSGSAGTRAVAWDASGTPAPIGELSDATAVSADGSIVLGKDGDAYVRWTASSTELISSLSAVNGMSADGRSLVGTESADASVTDRAALDSEAGLVSIGLPRELSSRATLISEDGQVVVGTSIDESAEVRIFRWQAGALEQLDGLSESYDVDADGGVIVGATSEQCSSTAGLWRQGKGVENLGCLLPASILPAGWQLVRITSVSDDGRVVSGSGINPDQVLQSWVAVLGDVCPAP